MAITPQGKALKAGSSFVKKHKIAIIGAGVAIGGGLLALFLLGGLGGQNAGGGNSAGLGNDQQSNSQSGSTAGGGGSNSPQSASNPTTSGSNLNPSQVYGLASNPTLNASNNSEIVAPTYTISYAPQTSESVSYTTPVNVTSEYTVSPNLSNTNSYKNAQNPDLTNKTTNQQKLTVQQKSALI